MKRPSLAATAALAATTVFLGISAPAAVAAPPASHPSHGHVSVHGHGPATHTARRLVLEQRKITREIHRTDVALARILRFNGLTRLADADAAAVSANVATDRSALAVLHAAVAATTTMAEARTLATQVHAVRPPVYYAVINDLRRAARIQSQVTANDLSVADLTTQANALPPGGKDVTAVLTALASASAADLDAAGKATSATGLATLLNTTSPHTALHAVTKDLTAASDALNTADAQLQIARDALTALTPPAPAPAP